MKAMGEARVKYNPSAPLIGVTSLPGIAGGLQLRRMNAPDRKTEKAADLEHFPTLKEIVKRYTSRGKNPDLFAMLELPTYVHKDHGDPRKFQQDLSGAWIDCSSVLEKDSRGITKPIKGSEMSYDDLVQMDQAVAKGKDKEKGKPHLDPNHSHFILVDKDEWNDSDGFGADRDFRAAFESAVVGAEVQKRLRKDLHGMDVRGGRSNASHEAPILEAPIPHVSVCVQGGPGTVDTVLKACRSGTSALLVRGSGQAADLLSDAVCLQFTPSHSAHVSWLNFDTKQDAFWKFLKLCDVDPREYKGTDLYDWGKAIEYIQKQRADPNLLKKLLKNAQELVGTTYQIFASDQECLTIIEKSLQVALTQKGWVYDLQSTEPSDDFNLALLKCLLNGIEKTLISPVSGQSSAKVLWQKLNGIEKTLTSPVSGQSSAKVLWQKLELSMKWSCDDIIDYLLERISKDIKETEQLQILDKALLFALKAHNVHALNSLIHRGTGMQMIDVGNGFCYVKDFSNYCEDCSKVMPYTKAAFDKVLQDAAKSSDEDPRDYKDRKTYFDAARKWTELIDQAKKQNPYFVVLWDNYIRKVEKNLRSASSQEDPKKILEMYEKDCWQAAHPIPETLRLKVYQHYKEKMDILKKLKEETKDNLFPSLQKKEEMVTNTMNLLLLEGLYVDLCGPAFRYRMGVLGDQWFDIFFWYVLQNDKDLACVMWKHVKYPDRSAICAAYLLRQMAKNKDIDSIDREQMLENSIFFDKQATQVQRAAEGDAENRKLAAQSLNCDLFLWRGITLMDLAVKGECESFLETESFKRSVHCRLYGDLDPGNDTLWRQFKLICSTLTFGLPPTFFPGFLKWAPPPRSEGVRHSTQRRVIPKGYPHRPSDNPTLRDEKKKSRIAALLKKRDNEMDLTSQELETLWAPTFGWSQRWGCFMSAPYVVFLLNCFVTFGVTLFFTVWFVWMRLQPASFPDMHDNMTAHEIFLNLYFVGCLMREISQFWVSFLKCQGNAKELKEYFLNLDYFNDVWNFPEVLGLISFFVGFWWRFACTQSGGCEPTFSSKDNTIWFSFSLKDSTIETYNLFYALSLFFNWIRVLRCLCLTKLGVTIGIFFSMLTDVCVWLLLYVILLVAISMLFVGTSSVEALVPGYETCSNGTDMSGGDLPENGYIACSFAYVLIRPMLQSFGEFSLAEMTNLYSFTFLLITYFFLNLVLINLLIATMSSTYNSVSAKAEKWKLLYQYELVQEHARRAIAYPPPFNLVLLLLDFLFHYPQVQNNLRNNYPDYTWGQRLERFLARNTFIETDYRVRGATHSSQDHDGDPKIQAAISALMERAQRIVLNKEHSRSSVEDKLEHAKDKLDSISKDAKCIQGMQQASDRGSTRARMLDKRDFYHAANKDEHTQAL
jgi:hypothetical protein